jgi:23S rRNA (adenine2030-N6)-methyltransferase
MASLLSQERPAEWRLDWLAQDNEAPTLPHTHHLSRLPPPKRGR